MAIQTNLEAMKIGDKIIARYRVMASGQVGSFMQIGSYSEASPKIPTTPSTANGTTPDGGFYLIYVDDDHKGRKILVADRNIQPSISWDSLNESGVATKSGLPLKNFNELGLNQDDYKIDVRLLTGGPNGEWTRYIVSGPVGSGNEIWNWSNYYTWVTSSNNSSMNYRGAPGAVSANHYSTAPTTHLNYNVGFRPVLVVESLSILKETRYLISKEGSVLHHEINPTSAEKEWITLPETVLTKDLFLTHGMTDLSAIPEEAWAELGTDFEILCFKEEASPLQVKVTTETLYDEVNQRYQGTGKAKVEEATLPTGVKHVLVQAMHESTVFTLVHEGVELGVIEPGTPFEVPGPGKVELYAELTAGMLDAVSLAWM